MKKEEDGWVDDFEVIDLHFRQSMTHVLKQAIALHFPKIKNLSVDYTSNIDEMTVQFDKGDYTKEEVETFINNFRQTK